MESLAQPEGSSHSKCGMSYTRILCLEPWIRLDSSPLPTGRGVPFATPLVGLPGSRGIQANLAWKSNSARFWEVLDSYSIPYSGCCQLASGWAFPQGTPEVTWTSLSDQVILRQVFSVWRIGPNIIAIAVSSENALFKPAIRLRSVAKVDSMPFVVRTWDQCVAGESSRKAGSSSVSFARHPTAFRYLSPYFSLKSAIAFLVPLRECALSARVSPTTTVCRIQTCSIGGNQ